MDELKIRYVESMEATGEMTQAEAESRFDQLMHTILVKQEVATMTLNPEEWDTKREEVARRLVLERHFTRKGQAYHAADAAMTALGFTRT